jgi:hypothetical protein
VCEKFDEDRSIGVGGEDGQTHKITSNFSMMMTMAVFHIPKWNISFSGGKLLGYRFNPQQQVLHSLFKGYSSFQAIRGHFLPYVGRCVGI